MLENIQNIQKMDFEIVEKEEISKKDNNNTQYAILNDD